MKKKEQITDTVLLVRPANFGFNMETASNNAFQIDDGNLSRVEIQEKALEEFDVFVEKLRNAGINAIVVEDSKVPLKTDAIFPNNWFSTHDSGQLIQYPLFSPNRRLERRREIIEKLASCYHLKEDLTLLDFEKKGQFLEGTGSMILDRPNQIVYACLSERTDRKLLEHFARKAGCEVVAFCASDEDGIAYYHTNVIMTLGRNLVVICLESLENEDERLRLIESLERTGKDIVAISRNQVLHFAGNMLEVYAKDGQSHIIMSEQAFLCLTQSQKNQLQNSSKLLYSPLYTIERYGGGSARCMLAEVFLEKKDGANCV